MYTYIVNISYLQINLLVIKSSISFQKKNQYVEIRTQKKIHKAVKGFSDLIRAGFQWPPKKLKVDVSENSGFPQIIHFNRVFHYFHHPFWEFSPIFGNT